ncbi:MAG: serine hydrolase [Erysipelotrichaceae bacterium]|nr:serine hydrolase [Erysipelotrichaceae bacterium]
MNRNQLHRLIEESSANENNITQIHVIHNGRTICDDCWHGFHTDDAMNVNSVTKGVMALLCGIAVDKGYLSIDQKVMDFFPDYKVKRTEKTIYEVTVKHLLTMSAPFKFTYEPWKKICTSDDWTKAALDFLGGRKGITDKFRYTTLGIQILAGILESAAHEKCIDFANRYLFEPLGIPAHVIHGDSSKEDQLDFLMNKNPRKNEWYSDPQNTVTAGWGLCLSARDLALIGELVLNEGQYEGKRIISENWISQMTAVTHKLGERFGYMNYGYLWYQPYDDKPVYASIGDGGNIIYVNREKDISAGFTGTFRPRIFDRVEFIEKSVLPMLNTNPVRG